MKFKSTLILLAVFGGLGAYLYFVDQPAQKRRQEVKEAEGLLFPSLDPARVAEVSIEGAKGTTRIRRSGDKQWLVVEPIQDLADEGRVRRFLEDWKALRAERAIGIAAGDVAPFGLDKPEFVLKTTGFSSSLSIGAKNPAGNLRYVQANGGPIEAVQDYALSGLLVGPDDFRSKEIVPQFPWDGLASVTVNSPAGSALRLAKVGGTWRLEAPSTGEADPDAAEALAETLRWAKIASFRPPTSPAISEKLAKGFRITLAAANATTPATVRMVELNGVVWGQTEGRAAVYALEGSVLAAFRVTAASLQRRRPLLTKTWSAEKLALEGGGAAVSYERSEGAWRRRSEAVKGAEGAALQELLQTFEEQQATQLYEKPQTDAAYGLDAPEAAVTLVDTQHGEQRLSIGKKGNRTFARAGKEGPVYVVPSLYLERILSVLKASESGGQSPPSAGSETAPREP